MLLRAKAVCWLAMECVYIKVVGREGVVVVVEINVFGYCFFADKIHLAMYNAATAL